MLNVFDLFENKYIILSIILTNIILINISLFNNNVFLNNTFSINSIGNDYVVERVWETLLNTSYTSIFSTGDFNKDGYEEIVIVSNKTLFIINGFNGTIYREITLENTIVGYKPIRDLNNDGVNEIVVITGSFTATSMTREFLVYNLVENRVLRRNSISIEIAYYDLSFDYSRVIVYRNNYIEYVFPYTLFTETGFKLVTYVIQYNVLDNSIKYSIVDNKGYFMYSDRLNGDIDNDGVSEHTYRYIIEQFFELLRSSSFKYTLVIRYMDGKTLFNNVSSTLFFNIVLSSNSVFDTFLIEKYENITSLNTILYRIIAVKEDGSIVYDKKYFNSTGRLVPMGSVFLVINQLDHSNETIIDLFNTVNGNLIARTSLGVMNISDFLETIFSITGLGDIDNDGIKEFFMKLHSSCYVVKTNQNMTMLRLENCSIGNIALSYKTIRGSYILTAKSTDRGLLLEVFTIYKRGVYPAIGSVPMPFEQLPARLKDSFFEQIFILILSIIVVAAGLYIIARFVKSIRKR